MKTLLEILFTGPIDAINMKINLEPLEIQIIHQFYMKKSNQYLLITWYRNNDGKHCAEKAVEPFPTITQKIDTVGYYEPEQTIINFK